MFGGNGCTRRLVGSRPFWQIKILSQRPHHEVSLLVPRGTELEKFGLRNTYKSTNIYKWVDCQQVVR